MNIDFLRPARLDDMLSVRITLSECRRASFTVWHELTRGDEPLLTASAQIACLSASRFRPRAIPDALLGLIQNGVRA